MSRVLIVSIDTLFPLTSGYRKSVYGRALELSDTNDIEVLEFDVGENNCKYPSSSFLPGKITRVFHQMTGNRFKKNVWNLISIFSWYPRLMFFYTSASFKSAMASAIDKFKPEVIYLESIWLAMLVPRSFKGEIVLVSHDILNEYLKEMSKTAARRFNRVAFYVDYLKSMWVEYWTYKHNDFTHLFLAEHDAEYYAGKYGIKYSLATNNLGLSIVERSPDVENPFFLYAGSLIFNQNYSAMKWYCEIIYPQLLKFGLKFIPRIIVTGKYNDLCRRRFEKYPFVELSGELSENDLVGLQKRCLAMLSPITCGSGIKIKNLEATQKGIPVIMTPHSAKGVGVSQNAIVAASDSYFDYAIKIADLLRHDLEM